MKKSNSQTVKPINGLCCVSDHTLLWLIISSYYVTRLFSADEQDIIDETLSFFKANVFFKSYEVKV